MSVLIEGMDMPKNCNECRFSVDGWCYVCAPQSEEERKRITTNYCPLVPIEWISVKDRLPSQDGYYLVAYKLQTVPPIWQFDVYPFALDLYKTDKFDFPRKKYKGKSGFYFCDPEYGYCEDSRVTHWMPLPTPPKENKDD